MYNLYCPQINAWLLSHSCLWSDIKEFSKQKYQLELPDDARLQVKKIPVLCNLCLKVGVTVAARKYDLDAVTPFQATDILNLQPVVKHSILISSDAKDLVETGKAQLAEV
ncbi:PREDICTED: clustered mitochondria protein-like isoform X1 [Ipomoea nil]|uniref:clustered mitochondria protein-like isoform X1 n=1 Tax=Ipomoea nil TaxID=35883 RepID=UPI0009013CA3|nr:PREDICTED: clustered mitochondria protein-like isoform X1 [Ipomoea nil]